MNLYEIDRKIADYLEKAVDPETGEIGDISGLEELEIERNEKIDNVACYIKNLKSDADAIKAEIDELNKRMKAKRNKADRLIAYLSEALQGNPFESARCKIGYRKSTSVAVDDSGSALKWLEQNGYDDFITRTEPTVSKKGVGDLLKQGEEIPGARLVEKSNISIK